MSQPFLDGVNGFDGVFAVIFRVYRHGYLFFAGFLLEVAAGASQPGWGIVFRKGGDNFIERHVHEGTAFVDVFHVTVARSIEFMK